MTRTILLSTLFSLAIAGAAAAETAEPSITVKLDGKSLPAIRAEVLAAADKVCADVLTGSLGEFAMTPVCVDATYRKAMIQVHEKIEAAAAQASKTEQVATATRLR